MIDRYEHLKRYQSAHRRRSPDDLEVRIRGDEIRAVSVHLGTIKDVRAIERTAEDPAWPVGADPGIAVTDP